MDFLLILLPIAFVLLLLNSQRKRTRQAAALQEQITVGTQICTTSGLFGTVVSLSDKDFVIEAAPGVHLRFDRRAIGLVVPSEPSAGPTDTADAAGAADAADAADAANLPDPHQSDGHDHPA